MPSNYVADAGIISRERDQSPILSVLRHTWHHASANFSHETFTYAIKCRPCFAASRQQADYATGQAATSIILQRLQYLISYYRVI